LRYILQSSFCIEIGGYDMIEKESRIDTLNRLRKRRDELLEFAKKKCKESTKDKNELQQPLAEDNRDQGEDV
jgi:hypothetical protein